MKWMTLLCLLLFGSIWNCKEVLTSNQNDNLITSVFKKEINDDVITDDVQNIRNPAVRWKRDSGNDFTEIHSKLTLAARIFSGISLRLGIHEGNVDEDELVSELLNLDKSMKLDDVEGFNKTSVDKFFENLNGVSLPTSTNLDKLEERVKLMNTMRRKYEMISDPNGKAQIEAYIDKIKTFSIDQTIFDDLIIIESWFSSAMVYIGKIKSRSIKADKLSALKLSLEGFAKLPENIDHLLTFLKSHKDLVEKNSQEFPLVNGLELIYYYLEIVQKLGTLDKSWVDEYVKNHNKLSELYNDFPSVSPFLNVIRELTSSRSSKRYSTRFINGFSDVIKLRSDVQDTWIPTAIENYDKDLVKSELEPFKRFESSFTALDSTWKAITDLETLRSMSLIQDTFGSVKNKSSRANFNYLMTIAVPGTQTDCLKNVTILVENIRSFQNTIINLMSNLKYLKRMMEIEDIKSLVGFEENITFTGKQSDWDSQVDGILDKMPAHDKLDQLTNVLTTLETEFGTIKIKTVRNTLKELSNWIVTNKTQIQEFIDDQERTPYINYFETLKGYSDILQPLGDSITLIQKVRQIQADGNFKASLQGITQKISQSVPDFANLRAVLGGIKSTKTSKIDELVQLNGIENHTETFGEAVAVLDTVQTILSNKEDISDLLKNGPSVTKAIHNPTNNLPNRRELKEKWSNFEKFTMYLESLLSTLDSKNATMSTNTTTRIRRQVFNLEDYAEKLKQLTNLPDADIDLKPMIEVLRTSSGLPTTPQMLPVMNTLDRLNMSFTSHNVALVNAASSVSNISTMFGQIIASSGSSSNSSVTTAIPKNGGKSSKKGANRAVSGSGSKEAESGEWGIGKIIGVSAGALFLLIVAVILTILLYRKWKKKKAALKRKTVSETPLLSEKTKSELVCVTLEEKEEKLVKLYLSEMNFAYVMADELRTLESAKMVHLLKNKIKEIEEQVEEHTRTMLPDQIEKSKVKATKLFNTVLAKIDQIKAMFVMWLEFTELEWINEMKNLFEAVGGTSLRNQLAGSVYIWKLTDDRWCSARTDFPRFIVDAMLHHRTLPSKTANYPNFRICAHALRLQYAKEKVETAVRMNQLSCEDYKNHLELWHNAGPFSYNEGRVKLLDKENDYFNGTWFDTPYNVQVYVAAATGVNTVKKIVQFIYDYCVGFTVCFAGAGSNFYNQDTHDKISFTTTQVEVDKDIYGYTDPKKPGKTQFYVEKYKVVVTSKESKEADKRTIYHYIIHGWNEDEIPRDPKFVKAMTALLKETTRHSSPVAFFDEKGGQRPAALALSEIIASRLLTYGPIDVDITEYLYEFLSRRGRVFTDYNFSTFGTLLGVQRADEDIPETNVKTPIFDVDKEWNVLYESIAMKEYFEKNPNYVEKRVKDAVLTDSKGGK